MLHYKRLQRNGNLRCNLPLSSSSVLQDHMSNIMNMLQRMTAPMPTLEILPTTETPLATEIPPTVEISPSETMQTQEMTSTSCYIIVANWETLLNENVDEAIA
ncbi:hypothetical protein Fot_16492 [Forsythia ovata]|uniref:Uncharacterized protein n=1 Tax=Forsythia ovata TaxID=205694 RepID=A0ABD1WC63_9LAMI